MKRFLAAMLFILSTGGLPGEDLKNIKFYNLEKEYAETITHIYQVKNAKALELKHIVNGMLSIYGNLYVNNETNQLYITDVKKKVSDIKGLLPGLDVKGLKAGNNLVSRLVYLQHENVSEIIGLVRHKLSPEGSVLEASSLNALVITDVASKIDELRDLLKAVDVSAALIAVEISIVSFDKEYFSKKGVNIFNWLQGLNAGVNVSFGGPGKYKASAALGPGSLFPERNQDEKTTTTTMGTSAKSAGKQFYISSRFNISDLVNFISENADGAVLASTRIVTRNNKSASINSYERVVARSHPAEIASGGPYAQPLALTGISLRVVPTLHQDSLINLSIAPVITSLSGWSPNGLPIVFERNLNTEVKVKNNTIFALGGLKKSESVNVRRGIPLLKDIPLLGYFFSIRQKVQLEREVLIFIKPTVEKSTSMGEEGFQQLKNRFEKEAE